MICVCAELNHPALLILTGNQLSSLVVFLMGVGDERSEHVVQGSDAAMKINRAHQKPAVDLDQLNSFSRKVNAGIAAMMDAAAVQSQPRSFGSYH